jgi:hypothetical protein
MTMPERFWHQNLDQLAQKFFAPITKHLFGCGIQKHDCPVALRLNNGIGRRFKQIAKTPI